jgi:ABC-type nickel/cobalt efflux system permease component RcnA
MRRRALALAAIGLAALVAVPAAGAHPLGNFSINHLVTVSVSRDRIDLRYVLDQAEIPTFQERGLSDARVLARKQAEVRRRLTLTVDGRAVAWRWGPGSLLTHPPGQGGLSLTRVELPIVAIAHPHSRVTVDDETFPDRIGWKAVVALAGAGTAVRSSVPSFDPTGGLRRYPQNTLTSPMNVRLGSFGVVPGAGTLVAPPSPYASGSTTANRSGDGFADVFARAAAGHGVLLVLLLAAFAWGALHALSPGHGKSMVAAYLVGTRGTARHALALGLTVTVSHTIGVFALGLVTLALAQYVLPEQLYPWLNLVSGLMVVAIGGAVLRSRVRRWRAAAVHADRHEHDHHRPGHHHAHHDHAGTGPRGHGHSHLPPDGLTWKGLIGMGASAGAIPCPSALVVLLGAIAQHQVALGLLLIAVFSTGLAATLCLLGLLVVSARRLAGRLPLPGRLAAAVPALSTLFILGVGLMLTGRAIPQVI